MEFKYVNDEIAKRSFTCQEPVLSTLNVDYNAASTTITLWNKFQIFVYENLYFDNVSKIVIPNFQIHTFLSSTNYFACIDYTGNVHTSTLKFKNANQKMYKYKFQPREHGIMASTLFTEDEAICLKYAGDLYYLNVYKMNTDFSIVKEVLLLCNSPLLKQDRNNHILKCCSLAENHVQKIKNLFNIKSDEVTQNYHLVLMSFNKTALYACLYSTKMVQEEIKLVKLYDCPSEIANLHCLEIDPLNIIITLAIGTLIHLNLEDANVLEFIHLNTAVHKAIAFKNNIVYTDGVSLWKAEDILRENIQFTKFFVMKVKDFILFADQVVCVTYDNIIYTFSIDDEQCFVKPQLVNEYYSAKKLVGDDYPLKHSDHLENILKEVEKNKALIKIQTTERNNIIAMSLANRQDVMDEIIQPTVTVYANYNDAIENIEKNTSIVLTNDYSEYFDEDSYYFYVSIEATKNVFGAILSSEFGDLRIHITLLSGGKPVKTTTIKVMEALEKIQLLTPLNIENIDISEMSIDLKVITNIPGAFDPKKTIWTVLYRKIIILHSENLVKHKSHSNKSHNIQFKEKKESLDVLMMQIAKNQYGNLVDFINSEKPRSELPTWHTFIKLPIECYEKIKYDYVCSIYTSLKKQFTLTRLNFLEELTSTDFLEAQNVISWSIGKDKVFIELENDGISKPSIKISSYNPKIALDMRIMLSEIIYKICLDIGLKKIFFINQTFYTTVENLQKSIKEYISSPTEEDIWPLFEQFERKIMAALIW